MPRFRFVGRRAWATAVLLIVMAVVAGACSDGGSSDTTAAPATTTTAATETTAAGTETTAAGTETTAPATPPESVGSMNLAIATSLDNGPNFAAVEKGIFEKYGLDVKVDFYPTGVEMVAALASGEADVAVVAPLPLLSAVQQGVQLKLVALSHGNAASDSYGSESIVASAASGVTPGHVADFAGKKFGVPFGTNAHAYVLESFAQAGLADDDVELINVAPADAATALTDGSIDGFSLWEPWPTQALFQVEGSVRVERAVESSPGFFPGVVIASQQFIDNEPDVLQAYLTAYMEAQQYARQDLEAIAELTPRWIPGIEPEIALEAFPSLIWDGRFSQLTLDAFVEKTMPSMVDLGLIEAPIPLDEWIDTSFNVAVQVEHPEFFSDLASIPAGKELGG